MPAGLTPEQVDFFNREGYLVAEGIFTPDDLQPLRDEITAIIHREAVRLKSEGKLQNLHEDKPFETRLTHLYRDNPDLVESDILPAITGRAGGGHSGPGLFGVITHPALLATVESLVGPEIVGSSVYRIRPKIPGRIKGVVPWHQDSGYFSAHCDRDLIVTCWIPLVHATPENGCLQVLPRAHTQGVYTHHSGGSGGFLVITEHDLPPEEIACYPPEADFVVQSPKDPDAVIKRWEDFDALRQRYEANRPPHQGRWQPLDA